MSSTTPELPKYRVRLFLAVDLVGSTAFKNQTNNPFEWRKAFQKFYAEFPELLTQKFNSIAKNKNPLDSSEINDGKPKLWKTIGDEIIFCCRLQSICHLTVCIEAFMESLKEFGESINKAFKLDTKGNAWVASFPTPNSSIQPLLPSRQNKDYVSHDIISEELERQADDEPHLFDFLGKGIDSGFRIAKNSTVDHLTISPGLAILLIIGTRNSDVTGFDKKVRLQETQIFKGVAENTPYPVLVLDIHRDENKAKLIEQQTILLRQAYHQNELDLKKYLIDYLTTYEIEIPQLPIFFSPKDQKNSPTPDFYKKFTENWESENKEGKESCLYEDTNAPDDGESNEKTQSNLDKSWDFLKDLQI